MSSAETREKPVLPAILPGALPEVPPPLGGGERRALSAPRMAWWRPARPVVLAALLLLLAAALIAIILDEIAAPPPASGDGAAEPVPPAAAATAAMTGLKPLASYAETVARPLFSPIRRAPAPAASPAALGQVADLALIGIVDTHHVRHALIQRGRPGVTRRMAEGEEIDGWIVRSITPDAIVLQHGATEHEMRLQDNRAPGR